jgi:hypothetical protein
VELFTPISVLVPHLLQIYVNVVTNNIIIIIIIVVDTSVAYITQRKQLQYIGKTKDMLILKNTVYFCICI